jgi:hypothetical protein
VGWKDGGGGMGDGGCNKLNTPYPYYGNKEREQEQQSWNYYLVEEMENGLGIEMEIWGYAG